jgi:hypothetical protein
MNIKKDLHPKMGSVVKFMEPTTASNEQTYKLQWGRHHQIHGVNHSSPVNRLTSYNEQGVVRSMASITRTDEKTYKLQ